MAIFQKLKKYFQFCLLALIFASHNCYSIDKEFINLGPEESNREIQIEIPDGWRVTEKDESVENSGMFYSLTISPKNEPQNKTTSNLIMLSIFRLQKIAQSQRDIENEKNKWRNLNNNNVRFFSKDLKNAELIKLNTFDKYPAILGDQNQSQQIGLGMGSMVRGKTMMVLTDNHMISLNCSLGFLSLGIFDQKGAGLGEANLSAFELEKLCMKVINSIKYAEVKKNKEQTQLNKNEPVQQLVNTNKSLSTTNSSNQNERSNQSIKYMTVGFTGAEKTNGKTIQIFNTPIRVPIYENSSKISSEVINSALAQEVKLELQRKFDSKDVDIKITKNTLLIIYKEDLQLQNKLNFNNNENKNINISINSPSGIINGINYGENPFKIFIE
jgi:hypothetical protein